MKIVITLTDKEKLEAIEEYIYNRGLVPEEMIVETIYPSLGEVTLVDEYEQDVG